jgi:hypothetical protein
MELTKGICDSISNLKARNAVNKTLEELELEGAKFVELSACVKIEYRGMFCEF